MIPKMPWVDPIVFDLVHLLSHERLHNYHDWIKVGYCLHNISPDLLDLWDEISKVCDENHCEKYFPGHCAAQWRKMDNNHPNALTIRSLHYWARQDNPEGYANLLNELLPPIM